MDNKEHIFLTNGLGGIGDPDSADTLTTRATSILHRAVLKGELAPGSKLGIHALAKTYGIGATPLREGLSRLVAAGFVQASSQRGFRVAPISRSDLEDITRTRILIEHEAFRLSMEKGDDHWEAGIVATLYRLRKAGEEQAEGVPEGQEKFDAVHKEFHTALLVACGSPRLLELHSMLYDQAYRYRQVIRRKLRHRIAGDEHQLLADVAIQRDFGKAAELLERHLRVTLKISIEDELEARGTTTRSRRRARRKAP